MLCHNCCNLDVDLILRPDPRERGCHDFHNSLQTLHDSAMKGCKLCSLVDHELRTKYTPSHIGEHSEAKVYIGLGYKCLPWVAGESRLWVWCKEKRLNAIFSTFHILVELDLCIPRSEAEWENGLLDRSNSITSLFSGRSTCDDARRDHCFSLAKAWLRRCSREHGGPLCHAARNNLPGTVPNTDEGEPFAQEWPGSTEFVPTRTINVGSKGTEREPFLEIHDTKGFGSKRISWAALSHSWGGKSSFVLTVDKLQEWKKGIPLSSLPQTFRDAVILSRELGLEHVWIDSLCIVQDSKDDWATEAGRMANIYRYSTIHLAAHTSRHSDDGFLKPRPNVDYVSIPFSSKRHGVSGEILIRSALFGMRYCLSSSKQSILATRGWVLQESLLSPRTLHISTEQIFWECPNLMLAEGELSPAPQFSETRRSLDFNFSKRFFAPIVGHSPTAETRELWHMRWYQIVTNYTSRYLTYASDVFPALSGLASTVANLTNDRYIAGLFEGDIARGLLWKPMNSLKARRARPYRAPTWSWASVLGQIEFEIRGMDNAELEGELQFTMIGALVEPVQQTSGEQVTYGAIADGHLVVEGLWHRVTDWDIVQDDRDMNRWKLSEGNIDIDAELRFDTSVENIKATLSDEWGMLQIGTWFFSIPEGGVWETFALILQPVIETSGENAFERIGIAGFHTIHAPFVPPDMKWVLERLTIV